MAKNLSELLAAHPREGKSVFLSPRGEPFQRGSIQRLLKKFKAKYHHEKNWGCHDLRHSFAFNYKKQGGNMYELQAILGHKSIQMTVDLYGRMPASEIGSPSPYDF